MNNINHYGKIEDVSTLLEAKNEQNNTPSISKPLSLFFQNNSVSSQKIIEDP